ncbi:hypothetical protein AGR1B_pAt30015 [Agrobacterium fabacearum S56]|nr:hypothetical protein AGR1B_pAt30015 [Agrobacterium fabacearum S56]
MSVLALLTVAHKGQTRIIRAFAIPEEQAAGRTVPSFKLLAENDSRNVEPAKVVLGLA